MSIEIMIGPMHGTGDPPNIAITFKHGSSTLIRVEMTPEAFALGVTGRLVHGEITRSSAKALLNAVAEAEGEASKGCAK